MNDYLMHFGIPGQKWGERRFQNEDGTLTPAGKERYGGSTWRITRGLNKTQRQAAKSMARGLQSLSDAERHRVILNRRKVRGKDTTKIEAKIKRDLELVDLSTKELKRAKRTTDSIIKHARSKHISLYSKPTQRMVMTGRQKVTSILTAAAAVASAATLGVGVHYNPYYNIPGVKYKATYGDHPGSIGAPYEEVKNKKWRNKD